MKMSRLGLALVCLLAVGGCGGQTSPSSSTGPITRPSSPSNPTAATSRPAFDTSGWTVFRPPDGSFELRMPGQPTTVSANLTSADWASPYTEAVVLNPGGTTGFSIGWIDYKPSALASKSLDTILAHGQATQVARIANATIVEQSQIQLAGHPGRAWTLKFSGGFAMTRAFIVGVRLYTLQAILADGDEARGTAYLDSFTLKS